MLFRSLVSPYTPIPIGGIVATTDFRFILVAAAILAAGVLVYLPFFRVAEKQALEQEKNATQSEQSLDDIDL